MSGRCLPHVHWAVLNANTIPRLNSRIVCGSANNQLLTEEDGDALHDKGILYAPDYVVNAGGAIYVRFSEKTLILREKMS